MIPLQTASRHPVSHIVFSPDGSMLAVAQPNYGVTILDRATGHTLAVCAMPRRAAFVGITFCGNGRHLAAAHWRGLEVFDTTTGARIHNNFHYPKPQLLLDYGDAVLGFRTDRHTVLGPVLKVSASGVSPGVGKPLIIRYGMTPVACSPDGSLALCLDDNRFMLLNGSGRTVAEFERESVEPRANRVAKFCPAGRRFAINDGRTLAVYDAGDLEPESQHEEEEPVAAMQRVNGTAVAVAPMPHVSLAPVFTLKPDNPAIVGKWYPPFALLADGRGLLVKRPRNRIQWWDAPTGTVLSEWSWRFEWVTCVAASADGLTAVAGGRFGRVLLWDLG